MADMEKLSKALVEADRAAVNGLVQEALNAGMAADSILRQGLIAGMDIVGERMEEGEMFIPEVLQGAQIMSGALDILRPHLTADQTALSGKVIIGTVKGDLHDIGKNLVPLMLKSSGFEVVDLGVDVSPQAFTEATAKHQPNIVALSALLTTTMEQMGKTVESLKEAGLRDQVRVIVGGAPVSQKFAEQIGADGYAPDAGSAVKTAKAFLA
mgnify:CR=1 FL=1